MRAELGKGGGAVIRYVYSELEVKSRFCFDTGWEAASPRVERAAPLLYSDATGNLRDSLCKSVMRKSVLNANVNAGRRHFDHNGRNESVEVGLPPWQRVKETSVC